MDVYDTMLSAGCALNDEIAAEVFDTLSESGSVLSLMDRSGNCRSSNPEKMAAMGLEQDLLEDLWAKVDDGVEPAMVQVGDTTLMAIQLATDQTNCGYLVLAVPRGKAEWTQISYDLAEALFVQITVVARLIEKGRLLNEMHAKCYGVYGTAEAPAN